MLEDLHLEKKQPHGTCRQELWVSIGSSVYHLLEKNLPGSLSLSLSVNTNIQISSGTESPNFPKRALAGLEEGIDCRL